MLQIEDSGSWFIMQSSPLAELFVILIWRALGHDPAVKHSGGPFGAAVVRDGVIISCAHNMVLHRLGPSCTVPGDYS